MEDRIAVGQDFFRGITKLLENSLGLPCLTASHHARRPDSDARDAAGVASLSRNPLRRSATARGRRRRREAQRRVLLAKLSDCPRSSDGPLGGLLHPRRPKCVFWHASGGQPIA